MGHFPTRSSNFHILIDIFQFSNQIRQIANCTQISHHSSYHRDVGISYQSFAKCFKKCQKRRHKSVIFSYFFLSFFFLINLQTELISVVFVKDADCKLIRISIFQFYTIIYNFFFNNEINLAVKHLRDLSAVYWDKIVEKLFVTCFTDRRNYFFLDYKMLKQRNFIIEAL